MSSSQAPHQVGEFGEHIPSFFAEDKENEALAAAVRRKGKRLLSINPRSKRDGLSEEDRALLSKLAEISGAVVSWNDFGMSSPEWETSLEYMESELRRGHEIYAIARCQRPETRFTLKKISAIFAASEAWLDYSRLDPPDKIAALGDAGWRARLSEFWKTARYMAMVSVEKGASPASQALEGRLLVDIAQERGVTPADVMFDVAAEDNLQTFFRISGPVNVDESNLERILKSPATLVGISDGGAHLQTFAGGDYTSYFLEHWVREKGAFTLEEGIVRVDVARRAVPRAHRSRHARNRQGGRPGHLRSRVRRAAGAADTRRHPRRRDPDDQGRTRHRLGHCQREPRGRAREAHRRGPGPCARDAGELNGPVRPGSQRDSSGETVMARVLPLVTDTNRFYWTSGADGRLRFQYCSACASLQHPAGPRCRRCRSDLLEVREVSGDGVVQSCTTNFQQWSPDMPVPYSVAVVTVVEDDRIRLTTNIVGCEPDAVHVGMPVRVAFEEVEDVWLPLFAPRGGPLQVLADERSEFDRMRSVRPMARLEKFEDDVAVSGIGMSRLGRKLMADPVALSVEAIELAVRDAGLALDDIDGLSTYPAGTADGGYSEGGVTAVESTLGLRPTWHNGAPETPGAAGSLIAAMLAVSSGLCRHVVCFRTVWQSTYAELAKRGGRDGGGRRRASGFDEYLAPFGVQAANTVAMAASQHFSRYGTTRETLGWIALNARANAARNPTAVFRDPLTMDDYLASRPISSPLGLLDCDPLCDGSVRGRGLGARCRP